MKFDETEANKFDEYETELYSTLKWQLNFFFPFAIANWLIKDIEFFSRNLCFETIFKFMSDQEKCDFSQEYALRLLKNSKWFRTSNR